MSPILVFLVSFALSITLILFVCTCLAAFDKIKVDYTERIAGLFCMFGFCLLAVIAASILSIEYGAIQHAKGDITVIENTFSNGSKSYEVKSKVHVNPILVKSVELISK